MLLNYSVQLRQKINREKTNTQGGLSIKKDGYIDKNLINMVTNGGGSVIWG